MPNDLKTKTNISYSSNMLTVNCFVRDEYTSFIYTLNDSLDYPLFKLEAGRVITIVVFWIPGCAGMMW